MASFAAVYVETLCLLYSFMFLMAFVVFVPFVLSYVPYALCGLLCSFMFLMPFVVFVPFVLLMPFMVFVPFVLFMVFVVKNLQAKR